MSIPSKAELERMFDTETAEGVRFVEAVGSWPSLRILDFLYSEEPATTGEIARELNMDMRDVKERLEELEEYGVVNKDEQWKTATDRIVIDVRRSEGIEISYELDENPESQSDQKPDEDIETSSSGIFGRVRDLVGSLLP